MKNLNNILKRLYSAFAVERYEYEGSIEPLEPLESFEPVAPPTTVPPTAPAGPNDNPASESKIVICKLTEKDLLQATICGEAAACGINSGLRILATAYNRAKLKRTITRGAFTFKDLFAEIMDEKKYQCWDNITDIDPTNTQPFKNCENLRKRVQKLKSLCGNNLPTNFNEAAAMQALKAIGFDGTAGSHSDPKNVYHYALPQDFIDENWVGCVDQLNITLDCKYDVDIKEVEVVLDSKGKPTKKCFVDEYKVRIIGDGCHVFVSNISPYRDRPKKRKIVDCADAAPGETVPPRTVKKICSNIKKL